MPERDDKNALGGLWSEVLRGLFDIRSKLLAGWFGRDPDSPPAGDLGWMLGDAEASRGHDAQPSALDWLYRNHPEEFVPEREPDQSPLSVASGWSLPEAPSRERDDPDLER